MLEHVRLMNHSITYEIVYDLESVKMEPYIILILFYLICMDVYHLEEYMSVFSSWAAS
jgi:hypothetical protein